MPIKFLKNQNGSMLLELFKDTMSNSCKSLEMVQQSVFIHSFCAILINLIENY